MNQNPHVHLRGPSGHLSLKAATMMINFTTYSKVKWMNLTINNGIFVAENCIYKEVQAATIVTKKILYS